MTQKITSRNTLRKIKEFVLMAKKNDQIDVISTILENDDCGVFITKENGRTVNINCLAVAISISDEFFCLDLNREFQYYDMSQII